MDSITGGCILQWHLFIFKAYYNDTCVTNFYIWLVWYGQTMPHDKKSYVNVNMFAIVQDTWHIIINLNEINGFL